MRGLLVVVALIACRDGAPPPPAATASLAEYLKVLAGSDDATRTREVRSWRLDVAGWRRVVVDPYRAIYADYAHAFDAQVPALVAQLAKRGAVSVRAHYAGDPRLTPGQARARWAVPVLYGSQVAELDAVPIDVVFARDGNRWRAITGFDVMIRAHVEALDPACARLLERAGPTGRCTEIGWVIADAALRADRRRFDHACQLAASLCAK
jgi:hypothetical protein